MARISNKPKPEHLEFLRKEICTKLGHTISDTTDCDWLSIKMDKNVSSDTLRRLFNIIKNNTTISISSLNYCAEFCGFADWGKFIAYYNQSAIDELKIMLLKSLNEDLNNDAISKKIEGLEVNKEVYDLFIQIILIKVIQKDESFFKNIFENETLFVDIEKNRYSIYFTLQLIASLCVQNEWLQIIASNHYFNLDTKYDFESDFFVEWVVTPQYEFYRLLLDRYYAVKKDNTNCSAFYHLILASYYSDINDWKSFDIQFKALERIDFKKINNNILTMRFKGISMIHIYHYNPQLMVEKCNEIKSLNFKLEYKDVSDRVTALLIISMYLHKCNSYDVIIDLANQHLPLNDLLLTLWGEQNWNHYKILYADSLLKTNQIEKAITVFNTITNNGYDLNFSPKTDPVYKEMKKELVAV